MNKKGISPLIATVLLVAFAVALGAVVMSWAKGIEPSDITESKCIIEKLPQDPLKQLQISYILGTISKQEYLAQEQGLV